MKASDDVGFDQSAGLHRLLLELAGWLPDQVVADARGRLAEGALTSVALAIAPAVQARGLPLARRELDLLTELLGAPQPDLTMLVGPDRQGCDHDFGPPEPDSADAALSTVLDPVAVAAVTESVVHGLWSVWRHTPDTDEPPCPVYLAEVRSDVDPVAVVGALHRALSGAGESTPRVEAFRTGTDLPLYQRLALESATLLWPADAPPVRMAVLFDQVDPEYGPSFVEGHPTLAEDERGRVLAYLAAGEPLLVSLASTADVIRPERTVSMVFRTDGSWVWTDGSAHYLAEYGLQPDPELFAHIRAQDYRPPVVDAVRRHRAMTALLRPRPSPVLSDPPL